MPPPADLAAPVSGELRVFAYEDTVTDELLDPFREANPDLDVRTATFGSNQQAAAKMAGGFEADVVEVCLDEMSPLTARGLLSPVDPAGVEAWDELAFTDSEGILAEDGAWFVPLSAGPQGLIYDTSAGDEPPTLVRRPLRPRLRRPRRARGRLRAAADRRDRAGARQRGPDEPLARGARRGRREARRLARAVPGPVALRRRPGQPLQVRRGRPLRRWAGVAQRIRDAGVPVEWVEPSEGALSWVCGLAIPAESANPDAAYALINWQASPEAQAIRADGGYVVTNPEAIPLAAESARKTADPAVLDDAIAETEPPDYDLWTRQFEEFQAG